MKVIDYEETMKCLDEVADCEDKQYAKWLLEWAADKRAFDAVPMSVIENIKSEIDDFSEKLADIAPNLEELTKAVQIVSIIDAIINKHVDEVTKHEAK